jgi:hypothetical protein
MPTIKNRDLQTAAIALRKIVVERLPIMAALEARTLLREIEPKAQDVEDERMKIVDRHAVRGEDGKYVYGEPLADGRTTVKLKSPPDYLVEETELLGYEQEVKAVMHVSLLCKPLSSDGTQAAIAPELLLALGDLLVE